MERRVDERETARSAPERLVGSDRVLALVHSLAEYPTGVSLDELARTVGWAKSTVHRGLTSLRRAGFARQDETGRYHLGDEFLRLAFEHVETRPENLRVRPALDELVALVQESTHFMILDGARIVYRAKVDPARSSVKLSSAVGGANPAHATAGGKALLAHLLPDRAALDSWVALHGPLTSRTEFTVVDEAVLAEQLAEVRARGYAVDREENERGVNCLAFPVWLTSPRQPSGAISVSALAYRCSLDELIERATEIRRAIVGALGDVVH